MSTYATKACDIAESQVGIREYGRPNRGGCEKYQKPWGSWMLGEPWCGAFVAWVWEQAGMDGMGLASPATATMCNIANSKRLTCSARPGAAFVICGTHTGLLMYNMGNGVWKCIEGNSGDAVAYRQRSLGGMTIYAPPQISGGAASTVPAETETWYYIEDVAMKGVREFGGWANKKSRDEVMNSKEKELNKQLRPFKREYPSKSNPYFFEDVSQPQRYYGGWLSKSGRDKSLKSLEKQHKREMRPFSVQKKMDSNAQAESLGKVD